jgi:hypothetical protein
MTTGDSYQTSFLKLIAALCLLWTTAVQAQGFSEPPRVIHGKVVKLGQGGGYQLFSGTMHVKLINKQNAAHVLEVDIPLRMAGANGEFSYRFEIDQETAPSSDKLADTLVVGTGALTYTIHSVTINGYAASLLDPSQAAEISTSFADRGKELRLDFKTDFPTPDSDGDGIPDWWERLYTLDPNNKADALVDTDGDGWNSLKEFQLSTNPRTANLSPMLQDSLLVVTAGGSAGVYLPIADADTTAANIKLTLLNTGGSGLAWKRLGSAMVVGNTFNYADILAGSISIEVPIAFQKGIARLRIEDLTTADVAPQEVSVVIDAFAPNLRWLGKPAVWLDAERLGAAGPVTEWADLAAAGRDGYQPAASRRPTSDGLGRVSFSGGQFFYLDDKDLALDDDFTAFMVFGQGTVTASEQALFSSSALKISLAPIVGNTSSMGLQVLQNGRQITSPTPIGGSSAQFTLMSHSLGSSLDVGLGRRPQFGGATRFLSQTSPLSPSSSFATIGAAQPLAAANASSTFSGSLREVLLFERSLTARERSLIQDYQSSRWDRVRVWNYRGSTLPTVMHGDDTVPNSISGGESDDQMNGGSKNDILRGGPGNNRLSGGRGEDRFCFVSGGNADVITDFSEQENDVIDLTEVFTGKTGPISQFLSVKTVITRGDGNLPRVDSILQLKHAGAGSVIDQTIALQGVAIGNNDLPRLAGLGKLQLGLARPISTGGPTLDLPTLPVVYEAESAEGTVVTHNISASDPIDGALAPVITPPSGTRFPIGDTLVNVVAINSVGVVKTGTFTVRVRVTVAPAIATSPASQLVAVGSAVEFSGSASGGALSYRWLKNGGSIADAIGPSYTLPSASIPSAGEYTLKVINAMGSVISSDAQLGVVDTAVKTSILGTGATASFTITTAGNGLSYVWKKDEVDLPTNARIMGGSTKALTIRNVTPSDAGIYTCVVTGPGGTLSGGSNTLVVFSQKPEILTPVAMPDAIVSGSYSFSIPVNDSSTLMPTAYAVTGLPAGLTCNATTGVISGKPTISKATPYAVTLKASNAKGSTTATSTLKVHALPSSLTGTFNGLADRNTGLSGPKAGGNLQGHGGRLSNLVISSTGSFTGTLQLEEESYSMPSGSRLNTMLNANASATVRLVRGTAGDSIPDLTLQFTINKDSGKLTGTLGDGGVGTPLNLQGWRQTTPTTGRAGAYTAALDIRDQALVGDMAYPQGNGYLTLNVSATGVVTWGGRLADGTAITGSSTVAANGDIPFHQLLYSTDSAATAGSARGWVKIGDDSSTPPANGGKALLDGTIDWLKKGQPASSTTRSYKQGFPLHQLVVAGGRYTPPATGQMLLGFVDGGVGTTNATLKFSEGGLTGPPPIVGAVMAANVGAIPVRITSRNTVVMPAGSANPAAVSLTIAASSGLMTGSFMLKNDPDPTDISAPVALLTRKANYAGVLVPRLSIGMGQFQLVELPSLQGAVKATLSTSPIWSGQVIFE